MWALMWRLAFGTGMRQGERFAVTPSELVVSNGVHGIMVMHELQRYKAGTSSSHGSRYQGARRSVDGAAQKP